jgi:two-component system, NarL family, response regulator DesR
LSTANDERPDGGSFGQETAGPKRVLLVDDHDLFREVLGVVLERHAGFSESVQAGSLAQARRALDDHARGVDLAVVDLDLPGGEGLALVEELCGASSEVAVVGVTASSDGGLRARALEAGAGEVLATSASGEEVIAAARRLGGC